MLGKDIKEIEHLTYWNDKEVDEYTFALLVSFENFIYVLFKKRFGVPPTRIQMDIAKWMAEGPEDRGVMAFRNAAKTTIASAYCVWWTLRDPRITIRVLSGDDKTAKELASECRMWYEECEELEHLHPKHNLGHHTLLDNARSFNVYGALGGKTATFTASPISGNVTGGRAHIILMDDIEVPNNCGTATKRDSLRSRDAEVHNLIHDSQSTNIIKDFKPFVMYLGTPHTEESLYYHKMTQGYTFRIWPARYPNKSFMKTIGRLVAPMLLDDLEKNPRLATGHGPSFDEGEITDPDRFSEKHFLKKRLTEGSAGFAKQFMLDVSLQNVDKYPLKVKDLIVADLDYKRARGRYLTENMPPYELKHLPCVGLPGDVFYRPSWTSEDLYEYESIIMAIDSSGSGADETAYAIVAALNGNYCLLDLGGMGGYSKGYSDNVLQALADKAKEYAVNEIYIERNFGDGMFADLFSPFLKATYPCPVTEERATGQKEVRIIETLEPVLNRRKLIVNEGVIQRDYDNVPAQAPEAEQGSYRLIYQMARITREKQSLGHDDRLDVLELAVRKLQGNLAIDQDEADMSKQIKDFKRRASKGQLRGGVSRGPSRPKHPSFFKKR